MQTEKAPSPVVRRTPVHLVVAGHTFKFTTASIGDFPEASAFLSYLLTTGKLQAHVAGDYVKFAARLKRQGRLADLDLITHRVERTAANAYVRWRAEMYDARLAPVTRVLARHLKNKSALRHTRVHSLVPPTEGKRIPRVTAPPPVSLDSMRDQIGKYVEPAPLKLHTEMVESTAWTLHIPEQPCAAHVDPCESCLAIELNDEELAALAVAFEQTWGHREFWRVPSDAYLFGEPPPSSATSASVPKSPEAVRLAKAEQLLTWVWDTVVVQMPVVHDFKNWSDEKWTELCALIGKPTGL